MGSEVMKTAIQRALLLIPAVARDDAWGWKEAMPAPPSSTMSATIQ